MAPRKEYLRSNGKNFHSYKIQQRKSVDSLLQMNIFENSFPPKIILEVVYCVTHIFTAEQYDRFEEMRVRTNRRVLKSVN